MRCSLATISDERTPAADLMNNRKKIYIIPANQYNMPLEEMKKREQKTSM
jgi:hypothetical protein